MALNLCSWPLDFSPLREIRNKVMRKLSHLQLWTVSFLEATNCTPVQRIGQITYLTVKIWYMTFWSMHELKTKKWKYRLDWYKFIMDHVPYSKRFSQGTRALLPTWFVYIASKALLNSIACSCFLESLNSTPSALVNFLPSSWSQRHFGPD